jgi:hypothetical protein
MADTPRQSAIDRSFRQVPTLVRALVMTVLARQLGHRSRVFYAAVCLNVIKMQLHGAESGLSVRYRFVGASRRIDV